MKLGQPQHWDSGVNVEQDTSTFQLKKKCTFFDLLLTPNDGKLFIVRLEFPNIWDYFLLIKTIYIKLNMTETAELFQMDPINP